MALEKLRVRQLTACGMSHGLGSHAELTYIFGSYSSRCSIIFPAKKVRRLISRVNQRSVDGSNLAFRGIGQNLRPRPSKDRRFFGGVNFVVRSWKARLLDLTK